MAAPHLPRRKSSVSDFYYPKKRTTKVCARVDGSSISGGTLRRMSRELISTKDFLTANKFALAVMQKQLYETAQNQRSFDTTTPIHQPVFKIGAVRPLAIACEKFESTSTSNR